MMCVNGCKQLRHNGPCEPVDDDSDFDLEMLQIDAERAAERYEEAKRAAQGRLGRGENP